MKVIKKYNILTLIAITLLLIAIFLTFPNIASFGWSIGAVIFFFLYELITILIIDKKGNTVSAQQSVNLVMGLKVGKILLSIFFVMIYAFAVKAEMIRFVLIFAVLYLIFLIFDTIYLVSFQKEKQRTIDSNKK